MNENYIKSFRDYFADRHDNFCNQKYDGKYPYSFHLDMVATQANRFKHLISKDTLEKHATWAAIYGHDSIEDGRLSYNELKQLYGERAANIIFLCTEHRGKTRDERHPAEWYQEMSKDLSAVFVKLCDIIANSLYSLMTNSDMFKKYKKEYYNKVAPNLFCKELREMFNFLEILYNSFENEKTYSAS